MPAFFSQVVYDFAGDAKPVLIGEGDQEKKVAGAEDFQGALASAEAAVGQVIIQNNADSTRLNDFIVGQSLVQLDGAATLAQVIEQVNSHFNVLTNLVVNGKSRGSVPE